MVVSILGRREEREEDREEGEEGGGRRELGGRGEGDEGRSMIGYDQLPHVLV